MKARVGFFFLLLEQASVPEVVFLSMGNCNTRILFMGTNLSARRNMHHTAAPAEEADYGFRGPLLRSSSSEESTFVLFENQTNSPIKLYWLNYEGQKTAYRTLQPGRIHRQQTFVTHPWTFDNMDGDPESVVVDHKRIIFPKEEGDRRAILTRPTMRKWSPENHKKYFPKKFVDTTQSFLLCYRKLRKAHIEFLSSRTRRATNAGGSVGLGVFPIEIIERIIELAAPEVPYILPPDDANANAGASNDDDDDVVV